MRIKVEVDGEDLCFWADDKTGRFTSPPADVADGLEAMRRRAALMIRAEALEHHLNPRME